MVKVIIAGSRDINPSSDEIRGALKKTGWKIGEVVSGTARGVDTAGEQYAISENIRIKQFPANWQKYGRVAGIMRNVQMADYADALLAFWDGKSRGTRSMISLMNGRRKPVHVVRATRQS